MMHPVGPHAAQTYWLRRALVAVVAVALVVGMVWWALGRNSGSGPDTLAAATSDTTAPQLTGVLATDPPADSSSETEMQFEDPAADASSSETGTSGTAASGAATSGTTGTTTATKSATAAAKTTTGSPTAALVPDASMVETTMPARVTVTLTKLVSATGTTTKPAAPKTTAPPKPSYDSAGRLICPVASISLTGVVWGTVSGQQPRLGMNATNVGKATCQFNATGAAPTYTVTTTAGAHVWSTADCFPSDPYPVTSLRPGEKVSDVIVWSGTTSAPGCNAPRVAVKAGTYVLVIQLGTFKSAPLRFTMK